MLDPSNDFNSPCYDDTFRRVFFFDQYNAHEEYFIELDYWIMREAYESRIGRRLDIQEVYYDDAGGGEKIFRDVSSSELTRIQNRRYFLGEERIDITPSRFGDIYKVTELYVYAPLYGSSGTPRTFESYESDLCVFPQMKDYETGLSKEFKTLGEIEYLYGLNLVRVKADFLEVGDEFYLSRPHKTYGLNWYYAGQTSLMTVSSLNNGWATGNAVDFVNSGGSFSIPAAINGIKISPITLHVFSKTYPQRSLQVKIKKTTEFFSKVMHGNHAPDIYDRFFPTTKSGIEAPEIDSSTTPTFSLYKQWMERKTLIEAKPSVVREIYPGLWMRERYQTEAR